MQACTTNSVGNGTINYWHRLTSPCVQLLLSMSSGRAKTNMCTTRRCFLPAPRTVCCVSRVLGQRFRR